MISKLFEKKSLFLNLYEFDKLTAEQYRERKCPFCEGPLHYANYLRKPRGELCDLPEEYFIRFSLCCGVTGCRKRVMPHSCRFLGRKIYWFPVIVSVVSDLQSLLSTPNETKIPENLIISRNTLERWFSYFREDYPSSSHWVRIRGLVSSIVKSDNLPNSLFNHFSTTKSNLKETLISCLKFMSKGWNWPLKIRAG